MRILDRYILRQFVQVFLICFLSLTGLYVTIDAFANLDEFIRYAEKHGNLFLVMGEYYAFRSVFFFDRMSGVLTLISAMFTVAWLRRHNEFVALVTAGIPAARVLVPVIAASAAISLGASINREWLIPSLREQLSRDAKDLSGENARTLSPRYDNQTNILIRGQQTFAKDRRIASPNFGLPPQLEHLGTNLTAANAYYRFAEGRLPAGFLLEDVQQPPGILQQPTVYLGDLPVIFTPHDTPELKPNQCFVASQISFEQLLGGKQWRHFSSTRELVAGLHNPSLDYLADVRVAIHARFTQPLLDMTLLFLGLPLVLRREGQNLFAAAGLSLGVVAAFMLIMLGCHYLGSTYLISPALAAWLPLFIFTPWAVGWLDSLWI